MLFDLRGRGRRRTVQAVYLFLAVIMAVGLIGFGIGGATNGGWIDSLFGGGGGSSNSDVFQDRVDDYSKQLQTNPQDAAVLAKMVGARYQLALQLATDSKKTAEAQQQLDLAGRTWDRYLKLDPKPVDDSAARNAVNVFAYLNKPAKAVAAQEFVIDASGDAATSQQYETLFNYAYAAGQTRKADLAYQKALDLTTTKDARAQTKARMDQFKQSADSSSTTTTPTG